MAIGTTNVTTTAVRNEIGASTNNVGQLCTHPNINQWALRKPAKYEFGGDSWSNQVPIGPADIVSGFRLGDFRGYNHLANPPLRLLNDNISMNVYPDISAPTAFYSAYISKEGSEMMPTANNNGFAPDYVRTLFSIPNGAEAVRYRTEIYNSTGSSLLKSGNYITESFIDNELVLPAVDMSFTPGSNMQIRVKQEALKNGVWYNRGYIDGGYGSMSVSVSNYFSISGFLEVINNNTIRMTCNIGRVGTSRALNLRFQIRVWDPIFQNGAYVDHGSPFYKYIVTQSSIVENYTVSGASNNPTPIILIYNNDSNVLYNSLKVPA